MSSRDLFSVRYRWQIIGGRKPCSVSCGGSGFRFRRVECIARHAVGGGGSDDHDEIVRQSTARPVEYDVIAPTYCCRSLVKPLRVEPCYAETPCPTAARWITGNWSQVRRLNSLPVSNQNRFRYSQDMLIKGARQR